MELNIKKGLFYGTVNADNNKQTYGYKFKHIYNSKGKMCRWYMVLKFLLYHNKNGVTKDRTLTFVNTCKLGNSDAMPNSNHDVFAALKNCGIIYSQRIGGRTLWFADDDKAMELLAKAKC